jgi:hypothetical protein
MIRDWPTIIASVVIVGVIGGGILTALGVHAPFGFLWAAGGWAIILAIAAAADTSRRG